MAAYTRRLNKFEAEHGLFEARAAFRALVDKGATYDSIMAMYGVSRPTVRSWAKLYGVDPRRLQRKASTRPEAAEFRRVYEEHGQGVAAAVFRVSVMAIYRWRKLYGIPANVQDHNLTPEQHSERSRRRWEKERARAEAQAIARGELPEST